MRNTAAKEFLKYENIDYYTIVFSRSLRDQGLTFSIKIKSIFENLDFIAFTFQTNHEVIVTCNNSIIDCPDDAIATMNNDEKRMNLCDV